MNHSTQNAGRMFFYAAIVGGFLLSWAVPAGATISCQYSSCSGSEADYSATADFRCVDGTHLEIIITNTSTFDNLDSSRNILSSLVSFPVKWTIHCWTFPGSFSA